MQTFRLNTLINKLLLMQFYIFKFVRVFLLLTGSVTRNFFYFL